MAKAKSVILLYLVGGAATQDMWDLKPHAPAGIRSEYKPIATTVPGIEVCEHLPRTARWMHKAAIVRSVNYKGAGHNPLPSYTGYELPVTDVESTKDSYPPSMGAVCELLRKRPGALPDYVYMPNPLGWGNNTQAPGPYAGFLGKRFDPLFTECKPHIDRGVENAFNPNPLRGTPLRFPAPPDNPRRPRRRRQIAWASGAAWPNWSGSSASADRQSRWC